MAVRGLTVWSVKAERGWEFRLIYWYSCPFRAGIAVCVRVGILGRAGGSWKVVPRRRTDLGTEWGIDSDLSLMPADDINEVEMGFSTCLSTFVQTDKSFSPILFLSFCISMSRWRREEKERERHSIETRSWRLLLGHNRSVTFCLSVLFDL